MGRYIMTAWLTYDVGGIIEEACSIVADIDIMGYRVVRVVRRGGGSEERHSAEQCERGEDHCVS